MHIPVQSLPAFSIQGQYRFLDHKGNKLAFRNFGENIVGAIYEIGNQLFEVFTDPTGRAKMIKPSSMKALDLYVDSIDIRDIYR